VHALDQQRLGHRRDDSPKIVQVSEQVVQKVVAPVSELNQQLCIFYSVVVRH
jgi:hypothetical protein